MNTSPNLSVTKSLVGLLLLAGAACASSPPRVNNVQALTERLQGAWVLQSYRPFTALELPLVALINLQFGQMRVTITGAQISAQGPGVQVVRTYQVLEADDLSATLNVFETTGASVRVRIEIQGNSLSFHPMDAPWSGEGTLQRL